MEPASKYDMTLKGIGTQIIGSAIAVHSVLGPGLLEGAYEPCLAHEIPQRRLHVRRQVSIALHYDTLEIENRYRIDLLVNDSVVVELKAIRIGSAGSPGPSAQLSSPWWFQAGLSAEFQCPENARWYCPPRQRPLKPDLRASRAIHILRLRPSRALR